jgi:hypothetical protein
MSSTYDNISASNQRKSKMHLSELFFPVVKYEDIEQEINVLISQSDKVKNSEQTLEEFKNLK